MQLKNNQEQHPVLIAAGGGGIGLGQFIDNGLQHGRGPAPPGRQPTSGVALSVEAGKYTIK